MRRAFVPLACILVALLFPIGSAGLVPPSDPHHFFFEGWEVPTFPGWSVEGTHALQDCVTAYSVCSLRMLAYDTSSPLPARGSLTLQHPLDITLDRHTTIDFAFRNDWVYSDTETSVRFDFNDGSHAKVDLTHGSPNHGIRLYTKGHGTNVIYQYVADVWYQIRLTLPTHSDTIQLTVLDSAGGGLALSSPLPLPATATSITKVTLQSDYDGGDPVGRAPHEMYIDSLSIYAYG